MPYKIVQTKEKGRSVLTSIPDTWEDNGTLLWPRKYPEKLKRNDTNYPQENWLKSSCTVKRTKIASYEEAEKEIERMCDYSDTERYDTENEDPPYPAKKRRNQKIQPTTFHNENFNSLAKECLLDHEQQTFHLQQTVPQKPTPAEATMLISEPNLSKFSYPVLIDPKTSKKSIATMSSLTAKNSDSCFSQNKAIEISFIPSVDTLIEKTQEVVKNDTYYELQTNMTQGQAENTSNTASSEEINNISTQLPIIIENQKLILNNQQLLSENQEVLILKIAELGTQFDEMIKQCSPVAKERNEIDFKIITSAEEAEALEIKLKDAAFKADLEKKFSVVCRKEKGKGVNNAYIFIDLIFSREFLKQCSWAGGSRKEESKICFRAYTRIFDFFFDLVKMTDKDFTKEDCAIFLKNVLRNSISRSKCKQLRVSTSRNRSKSIKRKLGSQAIPEEAQIPSKLNKSNVSEQSPHEESQESKSGDEDGLCNVKYLKFSL